MLDRTISTLDHSNLGMNEFLDRSKQHGITILVDIRRQPYSSHFPHFSMEYLRESCLQKGIEYHWAGGYLGGQLEENSLRLFANGVQGEPLALATMQLVNLSAGGKAAIMCAEARPENCHRRLIADYLLLQGIPVTYIVPDGLHEHQLSNKARRESAQMIYDRQMTGELQF